MKKLSAVFLKVSIVLLMIPIIAFGAYGLYWLLSNPVSPRYAHMIYPVLAGLYLASVPFIFGAVKIFQLVSLVGKDTLTIRVKEEILRKLKIAALSMGVIFIMILPFAFLIAQEDDAPGLILFSSIPVLLSMMSAAVITLFQRSPGGKTAEE